MSASCGQGAGGIGQARATRKRCRSPLRRWVRARSLGEGAPSKQQKLQLATQFGIPRDQVSKFFARESSRPSHGVVGVVWPVGDVWWAFQRGLDLKDCGRDPDVKAAIAACRCLSPGAKLVGVVVVRDGRHVELDADDVCSVDRNGALCVAARGSSEDLKLIVARLADVCAAMKRIAKVPWRDIDNAGTRLTGAQRLLVRMIEAAHASGERSASARETPRTLAARETRPMGFAALEAWVLERVREDKDSLSPCHFEIKALAAESGLDEGQVKKWFNNRRTRYCPGLGVAVLLPARPGVWDVFVIDKAVQELGQATSLSTGVKRCLAASIGKVILVRDAHMESGFQDIFDEEAVRLRTLPGLHAPIACLRSDGAVARTAMVEGNGVVSAVRLASMCLEASAGGIAWTEMDPLRLSESARVCAQSLGAPLPRSSQMPWGGQMRS